MMFKRKKAEWSDSYRRYASELKKWYEQTDGKKIDLDNPQTFDEKIQWLKLYDSTPLKSRLADKYSVRDWIKEKIGEKYLVPLLGVYDKFDDIDFTKLPNRFVIKCTHGSGYNIIVKDKATFDAIKAKSRINKCLSENYAFKNGCELHYRTIKPKIIIEKYIENTDGDLYDYKFWCFNGKVKYIQFLSERNLGGMKMAFYDTKWRKQAFVSDYHYPLDTKNREKPDNLRDMIKLAEKLSRGFHYVRVDFYRLDDNTIFFGEMTFTPASGKMFWSDEKINNDLGKLIKLPRAGYNIDTEKREKLPKKYHHDLFEPKPKTAAPQYVVCYKLFDIIPLFTYQKYGENQVWKVCDIPIWRVHKIANTNITIFYLLNIPLIKKIIG